MFEHFVGAKKQKPRTWKTLLISASIAIHAIAIAMMLVRGFWDTNKLAIPEHTITFAARQPLTLPLPPAQVTPPGDMTPRERSPKRKPKETTQPVHSDIDEALDDMVDSGEIAFDEEYSGATTGRANGIRGGALDGDFSDFGTSTPLRIVEPVMPQISAPAQPINVSPTAVEAQRIRGNKHIHPDEATKMHMQRDGENRIVSKFTMCLTASGDIASIKLSKSSGYAEYDHKIQQTMREWKYRPYLSNGTPTPICSQVTFIYEQNR